MELSKPLKEEARKSLQFEGVRGLPRKIGSTGFFVAMHNDDSVLAHGVVEFEGAEYKIGTKK